MIDQESWNTAKKKSFSFKVYTVSVLDSPLDPSSERLWEQQNIQPEYVPYRIHGINESKTIATLCKSGSQLEIWMINIFSEIKDGE